MKKVYFLETCSTCKRILNEVNTEGFEMQEIKSTPVSENQLEEMYKRTDTYESLFNKRARLYKSKGLSDMDLSEDDFKKYLLEEYTFLKRPVFIIDNEIFIGNSKKTVDGVKAKTNS